MEAMIRDWTRLLLRCLQHRILGDVFAALAAQLHAKAPIPGRQLADIVLAPQSKDAITTDPLKLEYIERLLDAKKVDTADVLLATLRFSKDRPTKPDQEGNPSWTNPPDLEEVLFSRLCKGYVTENRPLNIIEGSRIVLVVSTWMQAMVTSHTSYNMIQAMSGMQQQIPLQLISVRENLGALVVGIIENPKVLLALSNPKAEEIRKNFAQSLSSFITFLSDGSAQSQSLLQIANRLEISQKQHDLYDKPQVVNGETTENTGLDVAAIQLEAVMDVPIMNTRAGVYIFLNSLLVARPLTDDVMMIAWLHSRYKLEPQNMVIHLITAAFDVLGNAMYRSEPASTMFYLKSFLMNKIPILVCQVSASIFPATPELCITQALNQVDPNAFPSPSQGFADMMGNSNALSDVRQDFLNACALHGLILEAAVERLLGEMPMQGPPGTKYGRKQLLDQWKLNFDKVMLYIDELENLNGNAGAIVGAITDFISHLCETQMTMSLKQLAGLISKKPQVMDIMLQFTSPASILQPLCLALDEWHYDSDQSEYQLVYDEFGAILVLVMAFVYRYDFTHRDIGISHDNFIARLMGPGQKSFLPNDLTEEQGKHLGSWLKGFYDSNEGLSNDVFASCRPQDFYLIVPTLFHQTVVACSMEVLSFETVKSGLEYLGEPFLLPAMIGGLTWMASYALEQTHNDLEALMNIFKEVILSQHSSADVQAMHSTILATVTSHLQQCFRTLQQREPSRQDIEPLLQAIKGNSHYERTSYTASPQSISITALKSTVHQLSQWGSNVALQSNPPSYTHQQIYTAMKVLGASKTVKAIVDEIKNQTDTGNGAAALDVGTSIICAPTVDDGPISVDWVGSSIPAPAGQRTGANLREMLKDEYDNAASLVATDVLTAETIVRLHRRVEAQLASMSDLGLQGSTITGLPGVNIVDIASQSISDDISKAMDDAAAATLAEDITKMDDKALQRSMEEITVGEGIDLASMGITGEASGELGSALGMADLDLTMGDMGMDIDMSMDMKGEDDWGLDFDNM